jgi:benzoate-CoA ligase family protein
VDSDELVGMGAAKSTSEVGSRPFNAAGWLVDRHVEAGRGNAVAFRCAEAELTYAKLQEATWAAARGLRSLGVGTGDGVLMIIDDELAFPVAFLAGLRIGAVPVPLSTMLRPGELADIAVDSGGRVLVCSDRYASGLATIVTASAVTDVVLTGAAAVSGDTGRSEDEGAAHGTSARVHRLPAWDDRRPLPPTPTLADTPAFWLYTSGTTGRSKGAIHLHGNLEATFATYASSVLGIGPDDVCYSVPKLFFAFGLGNALTFPLAAGATAVLDPDRPTPARVAALAARHRPTLFFAPPGFCAAMADSEEPGDVFSSARYTVTAGEALPAEIARRFTGRFGTEMLDGIGSTEALHIFCSNHPGRTRPGSSGEPVAGYELKLVGDDGAAITAPDQPGALWVRGPSVAAGYWKRPELTESTFVDGWLCTGDIYSRSADGYYRFVGRNSDMMKAGGIWVSPTEVEGILLEHPALLEAAVVGSRDRDGLETTVAFVVPRHGQSVGVDDLVSHCRNRMAAFKRPRTVKIIDQLPRTATGKVQRFVLRSQLDADLEA